MGTWATATRAAIVKTFEAASGDMRGEVEPIFISLRAGGADVLTGDKTIDGTAMHITYTIVDSSLDDHDLVRIFAVAYLDEFTCHYDRGDVATITMRNAASGAERSFSYP
jgi:hypothetical protein